MKFRDNPGYSFDDVLLVPQHSKIASRADVDLSTTLGMGIKLKLPLLSANMDTVTELDMAVAMGRAGAAGVLHRFDTPEIQIGWAEECVARLVPSILSVGIGRDGDEALELLNSIRADRLQYIAVCVDVAHGDHACVLMTINRIRKVHPMMDIIAGNVVTCDAAFRLYEAGANIIKVGIGPGSVCSTRVVSGHGMPQLSAIIEVAEQVKLRGCSVIADGGIRYPGDIVKALAAGADAVMLGSLLAGTDETPGEKFVKHGTTYKRFRGMASRETQLEKRPGKTPRVEGVSAEVPYRGPVHDTLNNLEAGIRSGLSYSGAANLEEFRKVAEFIVVTGNTLKENHPHHPYQL